MTGFYDAVATAENVEAYVAGLPAPVDLPRQDARDKVDELARVMDAVANAGMDTEEWSVFASLASSLHKCRLLLISYQNEYPELFDD